MSAIHQGAVADCVCLVAAVMAIALGLPAYSKAKWGRDPAADPGGCRGRDRTAEHEAFRLPQPTSSGGCPSRDITSQVTSTHFGGEHRGSHGAAGNRFLVNWSATYDSRMELSEESLTDDTLEEVVAFFRRSNPFAQKALGWDTGRFMDFRWANNAVSAADDPGWFGRYCRIFRDGGEIRAVAVAEDGGDAEFIITPGEDRVAVNEVLSRLIEIHRERGAGLVFEVSDAEQWLRDIFVAAGLTEGEITGHEWEYDLASLPDPAPVAEGFTVATLDGVVDRAAVYAGISDCFGKAFGREGDGVPALLSVEQNPMFRPELSVFALSPEGTVVAYCRGTVDSDNGVCGVDPVCTHPDFQRLGLGKAVVQRCFANQRALDGRFSYIGSLPEPAPGTFLYRSLGPKSRTVSSAWTYHFA